MAGGKGTRISSIASDIPKSMIKILGKPILQYQIEVSKNQGYKDFIIVIGHLGDVIKEYFGDGSEFGVNIDYIEEKEPLGTAGCFAILKNMLDGDFILINGDIIFDIDINKLIEFHRNKDALATLLTHSNDHPYDSAVLITDESGCVKKWLNKDDERLWYHNCVNAGIHVISLSLLERFDNIKTIDLDRDVLKPLCRTGGVYVYESPEYVKDMGTPERYYEVSQDIKSGKVVIKNLLKKQKAIFLDRDGTINKYIGFLTDIEQLELLPGVAEAIKLINKSYYLAIMVTNQPVIARGDITFDGLREIHNKLETLIGRSGAYLDKIYFCPHHPESGFLGEITELKIDCDCRKPKPGMLLQAANDFNIDLSRSWMIGDSDVDLQAGKAAGCKVAKINEIENDEADLVGKSLYEIVSKIL